jgi:starch synthase
LADTVADADLSRDAGTGFVFTDYTPAAMMDAIRRAVAAFADEVRWAGICNRGMELDFSWDHSAANYRALYEAALEVDAPAPIHHH